MKEVTLTVLRETPMRYRCESPKEAAAYWRQHIASAPSFNPDVEQAAVLLINTRNRIIAHQVIAMGTLYSVQIAPREVFRAAIVGAAASIVVMHNHPSGDPSPSQEDLYHTLQLREAGRILRIELDDHIVMGRRSFRSIRDHLGDKWHSPRGGR